MQIKNHPRFAGTMMVRTTNTLSSKRKFDRSRLTTPAAYYKKEFKTLKIKSEWVKVKCCFHNDTTPSLNLNMVDGHFRCFGCHKKGGDIIAFHMQRYGVNFCDAVTELGAWRHD